jgi:Flp pilus assembly protein TadD
MSPKEKVRLAEQAQTRNPDLAPLHLQRGANLAQLRRLQDARQAYRQGLACSPEPDVKTRLLVSLATILEDRTERQNLFREAQALNGNLVSAAAATLALRGACS